MIVIGLGTIEQTSSYYNHQSNVLDTIEKTSSSCYNHQSNGLGTIEQISSSCYNHQSNGLGDDDVFSIVPRPLD
jgi:hypothetical protein